MMLSTQLNDIAEKEAKKTIASDHVVKALEELISKSILILLTRYWTNTKSS